jgi:hypothetical protein
MLERGLDEGADFETRVARYYKRLRQQCQKEAETTYRTARRQLRHSSRQCQRRLVGVGKTQARRKMVSQALGACPLAHWRRWKEG